LSIQFNAILFVFVAVLHENTPNPGCPELGVHITILSNKWGAFHNSAKIFLKTNSGSFPNRKTAAVYV